MPCSDYPDHADYSRYADKDSSKKECLNSTLQGFKDKTDQLTSMLCALMTKLTIIKEEDQEINYYAIMDSAQIACGIDIEDWFNEHKKQDEDRLKSLLKGLNKHELTMLEHMLKKK